MVIAEVPHVTVYNLGGAVPPSLLGPASTIHGTRIFVHGGKAAHSGALSSALYELDLETHLWARLYPSSLPEMDGSQSDEDGPEGRFFHSISYWDERLFIFGGMIANQVTTSDLWCFDLRRRRWLHLSPPNHDGPARVRWAHCSGVCGSTLILLGGQESGNSYLSDIAVYDIRRDAWARPRTVPLDARHARGYGSYRSVLIPASPTGSRQPSAQSKTASSAALAASSIFLYSNQNVDEAVFSLDVLSLPSLSFTPVNLNTTDGPPFLRFPSGGTLGDNIILGGTYLSTLKQEYSVYAYNMRTKVWTQLEYNASPNSSWNTSFFCRDSCKQILLGRHESPTTLLEDYNSRIMNFSDALEIEVADCGVFANAVDSGVALSHLGQKLGLNALRDGLADMDIVCFGARQSGPEDGDGLPFTSRTARIGVLSKVLEARWGDYYKSLMKSNSHLSSRSAGERSRVLFIPERYEVVSALVEWIYTGTLNEAWTVEVLGGLLILSRSYRIPLLKRQVTLRLHERLETCDETSEIEREAIFDAAVATAELGLLKHNRKQGIDLQL